MLRIAPMPLLLAAALCLGASTLPTVAQAKATQCKMHKDQAACTADNTCVWDAAKTKCKGAKK